MPEFAISAKTNKSGERTKRVRAIAYWLCTLLVAYEMVAGGLWDLLRIEYVRAVFIHLGYPLYLLSLIGAWKIPCAVAILVPRFPRLKEWAYAGAFFNYTGAAASHFAVGDGVAKWVAPLVFAALAMGSWALRPPDRRLGQAAPAGETSRIAWAVPVLIVVALVVLSLATLPKGPPPS